MQSTTTMKDDAHIGAEAGLFEIYLFGPMAVRCGGKPLPKMPTRKEQWLLALLALHSATALDRSYLAGLLWPEAEETLSLQYVRRSLVHVRRALGSESKRIHSPTPRTLSIDLTGNVVCDVLIFDHSSVRTDEASLAEAAAVYRGPLLQGCAEDWVIAERESRHRSVVVVLQILAERLRARGALPAATIQLQRALEIDPLCETALRTLMSVMADQGRHAAAADAFHSFRSRMHHDMNSIPDQETTRLSLQLKEAARVAATPERTAVERQPGYLPSPIAPLIGRIAEGETIARLLRAHRLVTLTGPGGAGKTRLAISVAEAIRGDFPDGAWFVDLSSLQEASLTPMVVLSAVGGSEAPGGAFTQALLGHLKTKRLLLILDNCEYMTAECCHLTQVLLRGCPGLRILTTSREPLHAPAEMVWPVPGLTTADALQLFAERATQSRPSFTMNSANAEAVDRICARLDRMPLAVEIVAARTRGMSTVQIAADLDDVFRFLNERSGHVDPRHQTLRSTLDWSYGLLDEREQTLLKRLSVFGGGWTLAAAEAVCADDIVPFDVVANTLLGLLDKSLIEYAENADREGRYRFLETTRAYASELLNLDEQIIVRDRHAEYFASQSEALPRFQGERGEHRLINRLDMELSNIRAALSWCQASGAAELALRIAGSIWKFWWVCGHLTEGRQQIGDALAIVPRESVAPIFRIVACKGAGILAYFQHDFETAGQMYEEGLVLARSCREPIETGSLLLNQGLLYTAQGDFRLARQALEQALILFSEANFALGVAKCRWSLGEILEHDGDLDGARRTFEETLHYFESVDDLYNTAGGCLTIAQIIRKQRQAGPLIKTAANDEEMAWLHRSLRTYHACGRSMGIAECLEEIARVKVTDGRFGIAIQFLAAASKLRESGDEGLLSDGISNTAAECIEKARAAVGKVEFDAAWDLGRAMPWDDAMALALGHDAEK